MFLNYLALAPGTPCMPHVPVRCPWQRRVPQAIPPVRDSWTVGEGRPPGGENVKVPQPEQGAEYSYMRLFLERRYAKSHAGGGKVEAEAREGATRGGRGPSPPAKAKCIQKHFSVLSLMASLNL